MIGKFLPPSTQRMKSTQPINRRFVYLPILVFASLFVCVLCGNSNAQEFKTLHPGVEYARVDHKIGNDPVKINLLRLDLKKVRLDVHHAFDKAIGVEPTSVIAKSHNAIAAINAGFFRLDKSSFAGEPVGTFMIDGLLLSESSNSRTTFAIIEERGRTVTDFNNFATFISFGFVGTKEAVRIDGINREAKPNEVVLYNSGFGSTTSTANAAAVLIFSQCKKPRTRIDVMAIQCNKAGLSKNVTNAIIPEGGLVISIGANALESMSLVDKEFGRHLLRPSRNKPFVRYIFRAHNKDGVTILVPSEYTDMVTGVPQLIKNGKIDITWEQEKASKSFVETRHPRTAVAKLKDGKFLMITVDGRQPGVSVGMNLQELAEYLLSIGASDAMNLDGGGSTTMFLDGKIVNTPSDKEGERKVSDAIVVTLRKNARR